MASQKKSALFRLRWVLLAAIPLAWCAVAHLGMLTSLENGVVDLRFRYRGPMEAPVKVVYVDVDSVSLDSIGNMPWNREYFATVARTLIERAGVKAIGMDFVFSDAGVPESVDRAKYVAGNRALGDFLWRTPSVVVAASFTAMDYHDINGKRRMREFPDVSRPDLPPLHQIEPPEVPSLSLAGGRKVSPPGVGLIDTVDQGTRWVPLYAPTSARTYYAMAVELARIYYGIDRSGIKVDGDHLYLVRDDGSFAARIPLTRKQLVEVNWFSPWFSAAHNPRESFSVVYEYCRLLGSDRPEERRSAEEFFSDPVFKGAVVLIGPTDRLLQDLAPTPFDEAPVPRVGVHGNLLKTIVSGRYIRRLPELGAYAAIFGLSVLVSALAVAGGGRAVFTKAMAVLSLALYVALAFQLFKAGHLIIPVVSPLGAAFTTSFASLAWQIVDEQRQKGRIKGLFGTYVSPALVERMVSSGEEPRLGGIEENITAYFSDIQSFSSFSEKLSPSRLVDLMNEYLSACTDIVQAEGGTLDKYIGDAVVAIYGAPLALPDHPLRACVAALRVHRRVDELRGKWRREGDSWPDIVHGLQTRIGLNTGSAVVGNMGSNTRFNYTMMGDNVNIAARMESGAKSWGVYSMCTEATRAECERIEPGRVVFRRLGKITVKGRAKPLPIHEMVALSEHASDAMRECVALFEQGLERYYGRDWDGAIAMFRRSEALEANGPGRALASENNPSLIYIRIAGDYRSAPPPADWDGVYHMKDK
ncbi:MAG: adenylate/guanylate cyclase domain-containing protein [Opitutaceae bacterium]